MLREQGLACPSHPGHGDGAPRPEVPFQIIQLTVAPVQQLLTGPPRRRPEPPRRRSEAGQDLLLAGLQAIENRLAIQDLLRDPKQLVASALDRLAQVLLGELDHIREPHLQRGPVGGEPLLEQAHRRDHGLTVLTFA